MFQIKHYETLETFNNDKSNLETPWVAYVEENSTVYYSVDDITKYRAFLVRQKDISNMTYEAVDLGLPSGLKWADRNVGASSPEDYGSYFQWGDTNAYTFDGVGEITAAELAEILNPLLSYELGMEITVDNIGAILEQMLGITGTDLTNFPGDISGFSLDKEFNWNSYFDTTDGGSTFNKYNNNGGLTVIESIDDAATVHMGNTWKMPIIDEIWELVTNTTQTYIDLDGNEYSQEQAQNGVIESGKLKGVKFTGSNGNSIFIPASGMCDLSFFCGIGMYGDLWCSSIYPDTTSNGAYFLQLSKSMIITDEPRSRGRSVRGVLKQ